MAFPSLQTWRSSSSPSTTARFRLVRILVRIGETKKKDGLVGENPLCWSYRSNDGNVRQMGAAGPRVVWHDHLQSRKHERNKRKGRHTPVERLPTSPSFQSPFKWRSWNFTASYRDRWEVGTNTYPKACWAITCMAPRWTGRCGAFATRPPSGPKIAQEKSSRSYTWFSECYIHEINRKGDFFTLIFVETDILWSVRPHCSATDINRCEKTES